MILTASPASPLRQPQDRFVRTHSSRRRRPHLVIRLARKNLFEDLPRFFVALAGVVFAVTLLTVQIGIFNGFVSSSSLLIEESRADIWVAARQMAFLEVTLPLSYDMLARARAVSGVARAEPMIIRTVLWRSPGDKLNPGKVIGFDPRGTLFSPGRVDAAELSKLLEPYTFAADSSQLQLLDVQGVGERGTIGPLHAKLVFVTQRTQPVTSPTFFYASTETANAYAPAALSFFTATDAPPPPLGSGDSLSYILVKAQDNSRIPELQKALEHSLPGTRAFTRLEMMDITRNWWVKRTSIGFLLSLGALMGVIVGIVVVGQVLYISVTEHLKEYGTLKAIGAADSMLYFVIVRQAVYMALLGYVPSLILSWLISLAAASRGVHVLITLWSSLVVLALTLAMCVAAAIFAMQRVMRVDPAVVFRA
jgi:putative ABC transport system permease protein